MIVFGCGPALAPAMAAESSGIFQWQPFLGPFHSVLLHFPIGFVVMAFVVDLYSWAWRKPELQQVIGLMLGLSVAATLLTIVLGILRAGAAEYDAGMIQSHRIYGVAVGVLILLTSVLHRLGLRTTGDSISNRWLRGGYRALLLGSIGLLVIAGHQGGNLTHGSKYLTKNAPEFVRAFVEEESEPATKAIGPASAADKYFLERVKPVFDAKCLSCHGPEKQKGSYRIDQKAIALKGGSSEKVAIKPGNPFESYLVRLLMLPADHDDVMPPAGKGSLTPDELLNVIRWIQQGAHFPEMAGETATATHSAATPATSSGQAQGRDAKE